MLFIVGQTKRILRKRNTYTEGKGREIQLLKSQNKAQQFNSVANNMNDVSLNNQIESGIVSECILAGIP